MTKLRVKNLTRFPYVLTDVNRKKVRLGASDIVEGEFTGQYFMLLQASKAVSVEVLDDDAPAVAVDDSLRELRERYQLIVGKKAFHGWDAEELEKRIAEAMGE